LFTRAPTLFFFSSGATAHHENWPLLILPSIDPNPAAVASNFLKPITFRTSFIESSHKLAGLPTLASALHLMEY
jgi:hypothetical protein